MARSGQACFALKGRLYAVGGEASPSGTFAESVHRYDPKADQWAALKPFPTPTWRGAGVVCRGVAYVLTGRRGYGPTVPEFHAYDPKDDRWLPRAPIPMPVTHAGVVAFRGQIYVFGGRHKKSEAHGEYIDLIQVYHPVKNAWHVAGKVPWRFEGVLAAVAGQTIDLFADIVHDGALGGAVRNKFIASYAPATGAWASWAFVPTAGYWAWSTWAATK